MASKLREVRKILFHLVNRWDRCFSEKGPRKVTQAALRKQIWTSFDSNYWRVL